MKTIKALYGAADSIAEALGYIDKVLDKCPEDGATYQIADHHRVKLEHAMEAFDVEGDLLSREIENG